MEAQRIVGKPMDVVADLETRKAMQRSRTRKVTGMVELCLDETGTPASVKPLYSTCFPTYDAHLLTIIRAWRYSPFLTDGVASPICTRVEVLYRQ